METAFKLFNYVVLSCLGVSAILHLALLISDSESYRAWVYAQVGLHFVGMFMLFLAARFYTFALSSFLLISILFTYINAKHLNYGNSEANVIALFTFWFIYGVLAWLTRASFSRGEKTA